MTHTVIQGCAVFDSSRREVVPDRDVLIDGERIDAILPTASPADRLGTPWADAAVVDGRGRTAVPGLIDCHTHLCYDGDPSRFDRPTEPEAFLALMAAHALRNHLAAGVTTVRDCGSPAGVAIEVARAREAGLIDGPRVHASGRMLTMTGGHGHQIGALVDGVDSATRATRAEIAAGAHFIKVMSTGGIVTKGVVPDQTALQPEELAAVVRAAHQAGKRVTAHATGLAGARNAVLAGVDSLEHGNHLDDVVVTLALERGVVLVPTLVVTEQLTVNIDRLPGWMAEKVSSQRDRQRASFKRAYEAGVVIATGTDGGTPFNPHGGLPRELELMVEVGMTAADALAAATAGAAANLALSDEIGSLRPGMTADILLVEGNPIEDISTIRNVVAVWTRGQAMNPLPRWEGTRV